MNSKPSVGGFFIAIIIGLMAVAPGAYADHGGAKGGRDPYAKLDLTADQQARITAIRSQFEQNTKSLRDQMEALHEQMKTARSNNETARIEQLRVQSEPLRTQMKTAHDQMDQQIRSVLTAAQITQLDQMRAGHEKGGKGERRGHGQQQQGTGA